jgi:hypothetical protein
VPAGWEEKPASGMRVASYGVKRPDGRSADISVVAMGGGAGGELENVNRWRDQIGLEPATEADLAGLRSIIPAGNRQVVVYELDGKKAVLDGKYAARTLAAILPAGEMTVFFKITGENALVAEQKPQFLAWLKSVDTGGGSAGSAEPAPEAPSTAFGLILAGLKRRRDAPFLCWLIIDPPCPGDAAHIAIRPRDWPRSPQRKRRRRQLHCPGWAAYHLCCRTHATREDSACGCACRVSSKT